MTEYPNPEALKEAVDRITPKFPPTGGELVAPSWKPEDIEVTDLESTPQIGKLVGALAKAKLGYGEVKKSMENPFYSTATKKAMYADLSDIMAACEKPLAENGLVIMCWPEVDYQNKRAGCLVILAHESDQWMRKKYMLPVGEKFTPQTCGSAYTYSRRYGVQGIAGVAAEFDEDGNRASGTGTKAAADEVAKEKIASLESKRAPKASPKPPTPTEVSEALKTAPNGEERVSGLIRGVVKKKTKQGREYRMVEMVLSDDSEADFVCFKNHQYADESTMFGLLDTVNAGIVEFKRPVAASFVVARGEGTLPPMILRPIALDKLSWDEEGNPAVQRELL